jgi:thiol-disulfide isomerase/thioredoxin
VGDDVGMRRTLALLLAIPALGLAACGGDTAEKPSADVMTKTDDAMAKDDAAMKKDDVATKNGDDAMSSKGQIIDYAAYSADKSKYSGSKVVLYFTAPWCPSCQETNKNLDADGAPAGLTVVRVDYDSETDLKKQYGITVQHSFVQVDEDGNKQKAWTGTLSGDAIKKQTV